MVIYTQKIVLTFSINARKLYHHIHAYDITLFDTFSTVKWRRFFWRNALYLTCIWR